MNSKERHEVRYQHRKAKREAKKKAYLDNYTSLDTVFSLNNLYKSARKCCNGVGWKASTQKFRANMMFNCVKLYNEIHSGKYKSHGFYEFDQIERGKLRHIKSVHISERVVQRCLCDYALVPILSVSFIYDNGACVKDKGIDFSKDRLRYHLQRYYQQYGTEGWALTFDFSRFFDRVVHSIAKEIATKAFDGRSPIEYVCKFIDNFGEVGLGLGSQISQICALAYPSKIDHYIKEILRVKYYARYMDDGYLIHPDKAFLWRCLADIKALCDDLGIVLNQKKTQVTKLSRGVVFLKTRFVLLKSGKVLRLPAHKSAVAMRRKLKKFKKWVETGRMVFSEVRQSFNSWKGHMKHMDSHSVVQSVQMLYINLFFKEQTK